MSKHRRGKQGRFTSEPATRREYLYGIHPVIEALKARRRRLLELLVAEAGQGRRIEQAVARAMELGVAVQRVPAAQLLSLCRGARHQGVVMRVSPVPILDLAALGELSGGDAPGCGWVVVLDGILDPRNLGAVIRTALCAGVRAVVIPKDRSASLTPMVSAASAGAMEHLPIVRVTNLVEVLNSLKSRGFWIYGLAPVGGRALYQSDLSGDVALVVGGEEKGLRPLVQKHCDGLITIPQAGEFNSLNASVAAGVAIYEVFRQRASSRPHP